MSCSDVGASIGEQNDSLRSVTCYILVCKLQKEDKFSTNDVNLEITIRKVDV